MNGVPAGVEITKDGEIYQNGKLLEKIFAPNGVKVNIDNKTYFVYRLVAQKYIEGYTPLHMIRFKNGNSTDLRADNLELYSPSENLGNFRESTRKVVLENKRTGEIHKFKSLAEVSVFLGYERDYVSKLFYRTGKEELGWWHDFDIYEIDPSDSRVINRKGKHVKLRNKATGEELEFSSMEQTSKFLGRDKHYLKTRLRDYDNLPESSDYEIVEIRG